MQSRTENILKAIIDGTESSELDSPQSRVEALLLLVLDKINEIDGGESGGGLQIHICGNGEYDSVSRIPTISQPDSHTFYLVPGGESNNLYVEWVYLLGAWERFGQGEINISDLIDDSTSSSLKTWSSTKMNSVFKPAWIGTAAQYAALAPDYDPNTIYFIKE